MSKKSGINGRVRVGGTVGSGGTLLKAKKWAFDNEVDTIKVTHFESGGQEAIARGVMRCSGSFDIDADDTQSIIAIGVNFVPGQTVRVDLYEDQDDATPHNGSIFINRVHREVGVDGVATYTVSWMSNSDQGQFTVTS
jgi:hypothetical protein